MKKRIIVGSTSLILGVAIIFFLLLDTTEDEKKMNQAEAIEKVTELYGGISEASSVLEDEIIVEFQTKEGIYNASIDRKTRKVISMELIEIIGPSKILSEKQAEEIALGEIEGEVENISYTKKQNEYKVKVVKETQATTLAISAETGEFREISSETIVQGELEASERERIISKAEAISIAKKTLDGEVQDVEFTETVDGGYYLVEIENDETDQEATIQIHAIRGETLTVDFDD